MIVKTQKKAPGSFTTVSKAIIENSQLTWKERGILIYLLSKPPDWVVRIQDLVNQGPGSKASIQSAMKKLVQYGYAELVRIHDPDKPGKFKGSGYVIYEEPKVRKPENQTVEKSGNRFNRDPESLAVKKPGPIAKIDSLLKKNSIQKETSTKELNKEVFLKFLAIMKGSESTFLLRIWNEISVDEYENIITHAQAYVEANEDPRYRKSVKNYLTQEEWKQAIINRNTKDLNHETDKHGRAGRKVSTRTSGSHPRSRIQTEGFEKC